MRSGLPEWAARRLNPQERYGLRVTLFALATLLVLLPFSFLLVQVTSDGPLTETDLSIADAVYRVFRPSDVLIDVARAVSFLGSPPWFYLTIGAAALFFWRRGSKRISIYLVVTNLVGGAIDTVVKVVVDRPRPEFENPIADAFGKSFPSGHAMASTVGYGTLLLAFMPLIPSRWRPVAIGGYVLMVAMIAASRLGLGVHYFSDVLGGFVLGLAWLCVGTAAFSIWRTERGEPTVHVTEGVEPETAD
ncbi:MAG TPA: phosphatase PAP2 family protein [Actinomycetota bacterium]|nr:phosphatase PAP2 family protein [Actinomycetota bacterium]